ncbi:MAG: hypothetical protein HN793_07935 [Rhodospirillaceae bacterium]|jgi:hypothetical protein|nr:hypothetical protein [Rhodospirillaceae bacterium]MBT5240911.1 hypothetical protein [Rhodospirillaceae bacterium]MBT5564988.1 hypothetical protein [Rhodospirillaceae bacterium]MBT6090248.1 hypothetical protein [Rhodospirillaceae bacterium]MBT7450744.1 hypothetical protein [Rhodospirillaceae bacterium]
MNDLQSLSAYPVGARPEGVIEEVTVKGKKKDDEGFTFWDFLDVINPLQHIPVVNTIYREMTGDEIKAPAKMIGSAIIGGPIGLAVAMVDSAIEDSTGKDLGGHAMAMFRGEGETDAAPATATQVASATNATAVAQQSIAKGPREFIPASVSTVASAQFIPASLMASETENEEAAQAARSDQQTEAAIAASAAAAPQGLVFMPLAGRTNSAFKPVVTAAADQQFLAIDRSGLRTTARATAARQELDQAALAQLQGQGAVPGGLSPNAKGLDSLLGATRPQGDTGKFPAADPFAAARLLAEETDPVMVPAWFDKTMMDAMGKYEAMQNAGS